VFLQRLARTLERPDLEQRARSILKRLAWCLGAMGLFVAAAFLRSFVPRPHVYLRWAWILFYYIAVLGILVFLPFLFLRSFRLIRALQGEITQRL